MKISYDPRRRQLLLAGLAFALTACAPLAAPTSAPAASLPAATAVPTAAVADAVAPDCSAGVTPAQTEGPYYKANTPENAALAGAGTAGTPVVVTGYVLTADCRPIANARLDFWQADDQGNYDNSGYNLRGHQFTDAQGRYTLSTILPGIYPGRTRHIHVKVQAPGQAELTTQLYFPEDAQLNQADGIYNAQLLVKWQTTAAGKVAVYNFVLAVQ